MTQRLAVTEHPAVTEHLSIDRLSVISRALASEPDEASTVARAVELGALVLNCAMVDMLRLRPCGSPTIVASTDPARSHELIEAGDSAPDHPALLCCPVHLSAVVADPLAVADPLNGTRHAGSPGWLPSLTGVRSMSSTGSPTPAGSRYLLRFLSVGSTGWAEPAVLLAGAFADLAALAIDRSALRSKAQNLALGLESNRLIGTAVGILMAGRRTTYDQAFTLLRVCSQETNRKLIQIADEVVLTGELPGRTDRGAA
jgi:hypothetical protein